MNFAKFLRISFFTEHLQWLLVIHTERETERDRETERQREKERDTEREERDCERKMFGERLGSF